MARPDKKQGPFDTVRVRVRPGASIKLAKDKTAVGGDWIELSPADLEFKSLRQAVETEEEIAGAKAGEKKVAVHGEQSSREFETMRTAARAHNKAFSDARQNAERREAEAVAKHYKDRDDGMARDLVREP
jgi:hypothetical protein